MPQPLPLDAVAVKGFRHYLTREYPNEVRACLAALSEDEIWRAPAPGANAIGHLVLHLLGATRHLVGDGVGGDSYPRDRDAEFSTAERAPREDLLRRIDGMTADVGLVLDRMTPESLLTISDRTDFKVSRFQLLVGAMKRSLAMRWRPKGSGGAGQSAVLPRRGRVYPARSFAYEGPPGNRASAPALCAPIAAHARARAKASPSSRRLAAYPAALPTTP